MLFKQLIAFSAIIFVLAGCSDQPMQEGGTTPPSNGDNTNGVNNSTSGGGDKDSGSQPPSLTDPTTGNDNAPIAPPAVSSLSRKSLTISGSVSGSQAEDTYAFKVCVGQVCDSWQQVMSEGMYQRKFHLSQWSTNVPLTIEGNKQANPASQPADAIDALSSSYFKTEVAPFEQLIKRDSNNDGMVDEKELATLSLNSVNMAFHVVAKHLLSTKLIKFNNLPYESKAQMVRQYLSKHSDIVKTATSNSQSKLTTTNASLIYNQELVLELASLYYMLSNENINERVTIKNSKSLDQFGGQILKELDLDSSLSLFQHYEKSFSDSKVIDTSNSTPSQTLRLELYKLHFQSLVKANHIHPLKPAILALAPERYLKISGRFPKELEQASLSIVIGSLPPSPGLNGKGKHPERHIPIDLIDTTNQRHKELDLSGKNSFITTIALRDIDNLYSHCQPGSVNYVYTSDEMQDTLTVHIRDKKTGAEVRSMLGSFCEIARFDQQHGDKNGVLNHEEFKRLNVGYISTAQAALLLKSSLSSRGSTYKIAPLTLEEIESKYNHLPRKQVELLASFIALQTSGMLFNSPVDLGEGGTFYEDLLSLLDITWGLSRPSQSNKIPSTEELQDKLANRYAINQVLIANPDVNISHITQAITQSLGNSEVDQYYFPPGIRPGSWVTVNPVSIIGVICQKTIQDNQLIGLRIEGKGKNDLDHWVTIGWDEQAGASGYTLAWSETPFNQIDTTQNVLTIDEYGRTRATLSGLEIDKQYYIRVQSNVGSPSALLSYSPRSIHVADSRVTEGLSGDDSTRGRDSSSECDPLTGKAKNSKDDGVLGARYLKLDSTGKPLSRQDLSYQALPFACVVDAHTGLVWETKHQRGEDEDPTIYDSNNRFVITPAAGATQFGGTCTVHETGQISTDPNQCTVAKQIAAFNSIKRCGLSNWRTPTFHEAYALVDFTHESSGIDSQYFPHVQAMWLDEPSVDATTYLWLSLQTKSTASTDINHYQPLMLVSDGFHVEQQ